MITDDRIKQLMEQVGMPNSMSLYQAFKQLAMEQELEIERLRSDLEMTRKAAGFPPGEPVSSTKSGNENHDSWDNRKAATRPHEYARIHVGRGVQR